MTETTTFENPSADELRAIYAEAETIAVVGASSDPEKPSHSVPEYLLSMGYHILPVSPRGGELLGERVYMSLEEIDLPVDVVEVFRPPQEVPSIARQAAAIGAKVLWMQPGIVSEEGAAVGRELGMTVAMDICMRATHLLLGLGPVAPTRPADGRLTGWGGDPISAPSLDDFVAAARRLRDTVVRTPLLPLHSYQGGTDIWLKPETLQPVGSFKIRGVYNWAAGLTEADRSRGLSTTSAGNTAQALGYAARVFGVPARSLVPEWLPANKGASLERYGVDLVRVPFDDLLDYMFEERWRSEPYSYLNPWGQPELLAGHGTAGLEIIEDMPAIDSVFVPVGGGGLIAGIGSAVKAVNPTVRVAAVQAEVNPAFQAALDAGRSVWIDWQETICEGASVPIIVDEMFPLLKSVTDDVVLVSEAETDSHLICRARPRSGRLWRWLRRSGIGGSHRS